MTWAIRRLTEDDAAAFQAVRLEGLRDHPMEFVASHSAEAAFSDAEVRERLTRNAVFGAFGPELMGVAGLQTFDGEKRRHRGYLWGMYVRPAARGAGFGEALVRAVLEHAASVVEIVLLGVVPENVAARRLYERMGFVAYGREPRALKLDGEYVDDLMMARRVDGGG